MLPNAADDEVWFQRWYADPAFQAGCRLWNANQPFAAHEAWELLWQKTVGAERQILQGMIQIAAAAVKAERGHRRGTLSLLDKGLRNLRGAAGNSPQWLLRWVAGLEIVRQRLEAGPWLATAPALFPPLLRAGADA